MKIRQLTAAVLATAMLGSLTGCASFGFSPEELLEAPRLTKQQEEIREALAEAVGTGEFRFFTPRGGENRTPVLFADVYGSSDSEAIVLYQFDASPDETRVNILTRGSEGAWTELCDFVPAAGSTVDRVEFASVEPTGYKQIFIGTALYTGRESALSVWEIDTGKPLDVFDTSYSEMAVSDLTGDETDELAILRINADGTSVFSLYDHGGEENGIVLSGEETLEMQFLSFTCVTVGALDTGSRAVFIDGRVTGDSYATEVVAVRNGRPEKIFGADCPQRTVSLTCLDVDGDGNPEVPLQETLPGYADVATNDRVIEIDWVHLSVAGFTERTVSAVNRKWQYLFVIPERLCGSVTMLSDDDNDTWTLCMWDEEKKSTSRKILTVKCHVSSQWEETAALYPEETLLLTNGNVCYTVVFYQENIISFAELKELIIFL